MIRLLGWFTVETTSGLIMLATWFLLVLRPYAAGLITLEHIFSLSISFPLFRTSLFILGWALILLRKVHWVAYILLLSPLWLYTLSLVASTALGQQVGPIGFVFGLMACGLSIYIRLMRPRCERTKQEDRL